MPANIVRGRLGTAAEERGFDRAGIGSAAIDGTGIYTELGTFANLWTVTLDGRGRCVMFRMWNNQIQS